MKFQLQYFVLDLSVALSAPYLVSFQTTFAADSPSLQRLSIITILSDLSDGVIETARVCFGGFCCLPRGFEDLQILLTDSS